LKVTALGQIGWGITSAVSLVGLCVLQRCKNRGPRHHCGAAKPNQKINHGNSIVSMLTGKPWLRERPETNDTANGCGKAIPLEWR
jgi:hypothetical protein